MKRTPIVIAHRGASGYLPEHTLPAVAMAHAMGADYLEPDLVLTQDGIPIVLHDIVLEPTTNAASLFPDGAREDGHWYAIDFTLSQIKTLRVHERVDKTGQPVFPNRFPLHNSRFEVPTFVEWLELIQGLNKSTGRTVGIYPELKAPAFHEAAGFSFAKMVFALLASYGYQRAEDPVFIQCFDPEYLRYCRQTLKSQLPFIQLIAPNEWREAKVDFSALQSEAGLKATASYAQGIGVWMNQVVPASAALAHHVVCPNLVSMAHQAGLLVHAYTLRADELPPYAADFDSLLDLFFNTLQVDGVFTDFSDRAVKFLDCLAFRVDKQKQA